MTTHELAKKLLEMPDVMVTIDGYEGGIKEIHFINEPTELRLKVHNAWYYGSHEYVTDYEPKNPGEVTVIAVNIG